MSGMSSTPGQTLEADGTPASPEVPGMPGTTIRELSEGYDALEAEFDSVEPGGPGSTTDNVVSVPATTGDVELDQMLAEADQLGSDDGSEYGDDGQLVEAAEYADPAEVEEEDGELDEASSEEETAELDAEANGAQRGRPSRH
jgi:hypothetical protein